MTDSHVDNLQVPGRSLGKRPPSNKPALRLADILAVTPTHPPVADHLSKVTDWNILGNDAFGDCGPVSVANSRAVTTKYLTAAELYPDLDAVFDLYRRSGNPNFDPKTDADDNGVDMQTMLGALLKGGIKQPDGSIVKPIAFAKVDHTNVDEIRAAIAAFGFVLFGVSLQASQQTQTDAGLWDYVPSAAWGGHAVIGGAYSSDGIGSDIVVETWAQLVGLTDAFITHQVDEVWAVIWPEHAGTAQFETSINRAALVQAYNALTGKTIIWPTPVTPPPPGPTPTPTPGPGAGFLVDPSAHPGLAAAIDKQRVKHKGSDPAGHMTPGEYTEALLASHLLHIPTLS